MNIVATSLVIINDFVIIRLQAARQLSYRKSLWTDSFGAFNTRKGLFSRLKLVGSQKQGYSLSVSGRGRIHFIVGKDVL